MPNKKWTRTSVEVSGKAISNQAVTLAKQLITHLIDSDPSIDPNAPRRHDPAFILKVQVNDADYLISCSQPKQLPSRVQLTPHEWKIARLVNRGYSDKVIAELLEISPHTVHSHLQHIFLKLGVASRTAMLAQLSPYDLTSGD